MMNFQIVARRELWNDRVGFLVCQRDYRNRITAFAKDLVLEEYQEGSYIAPTFHLEMTECQSLIDSLWEAGLRPTEGTGSAGSLAATQRHLEDMRKLVFKE